MDIREQLFALQDEEYRDFQCALMPTISRSAVIGVRTPQLRRLAKTLAKSPDAERFLNALPHRYYEENNLHAYLLGEIADFDVCARAVDTFLPYVDNWATCDGMNPKVFAREADRLLPWIERWIALEHVYTIRYGIVMLMKHFLSERFRAEYLERVAALRSEAYYVRMAVAWYFAEAIARQPQAALGYIEKRRLPPWTHNKAIQKATESFRVPEETKRYLKSLKA